MKLFVATHNQHKIREISQILPGFEIVPDDPEGVEENAPDFAGNALIKVRAIAEKHKGEWCMADDSGLEVKALGGAPGVHTARYAELAGEGDSHSSDANMRLLLRKLEKYNNRNARFRTVIALLYQGEEYLFEGICEGTILTERHGTQMTADEKNAISHRGRATQKLAEFLKNS